MSDETSVVSSSNGGGVVTGKRDRFFLGMSGAMLVILLLGFAPTLYFRAFVDVQPIPFYLHLHGVVVTSWYVWVLFQASLVNIGRPEVHRRIGMAGLVIAVGVLILAPMATLKSVPRLAAMTDFESLVVVMSWVVSQNVLIVIAFVGFVAAAICYRKQPDWHRRYMLFASMSILPPAVARISRWSIWGMDEPTFVTPALILLLLPFIAHDLIVEKRLHKATIIGVAIITATTFAPLWLADVEFVQEFVRWLV
jgi:hypothetical protein